MLENQSNINTDNKQEQDADTRLQKQLEANRHKLQLIDEHIKMKKEELEKIETEIADLKKGYTGV